MVDADGVESESKSVALLNCGTPAYRILPNDSGRTLYMTVLRSPNTPVFLHEPINYSMQEYDGMRDEGIHSFAFELAAYGSTFAKSRVFSDAEQFSRPPLCVREPLEAELPAILSGLGKGRLSDEYARKKGGASGLRRYRKVPPAGF